MTGHGCIADNDTASEYHCLGFFIKTRGVRNRCPFLEVGIQETMVYLWMSSVLEAGWVGGYVLYLLAKNYLEMCQDCGLW